MFAQKKYCICLVIRLEFIPPKLMCSSGIKQPFLFQNNTKDLDNSNKKDLDFWIVQI